MRGIAVCAPSAAFCLFVCLKVAGGSAGFIFALFVYSGKILIGKASPYFSLFYENSMSCIYNSVQALNFLLFPPRQEQREGALGGHGVPWGRP